ncbi:hypothetical protein [Neptunomonas sp. XY-337]|uniref:hypothetical protein n=1 Tax=Neptunomonas sp. XY-337 TaxID=2561897 RepID=UPI00197DEBBB|nr:hypothetical protein [Neptunomonas sp. XY-337]
MLSNKAFLTVHGVIYMIFALALFFLPSVFWPVYGVEINDKYALFLSQHTSIFLGGIGAITYLLRDIEPGKTAKRLLAGVLITNLLGVAITLYAALIGIFVGFGWSDPIFFALLSVIGYLQFSKQ